MRANPDLLGPRLIDPATGKLLFSFHSFIVKTGNHTILIDSCLGNDKERPTRPQFHRLRTSYFADLARAGVRAEDVDYVMCTHLHWDHVGWNTRLDNGRWVPTFPNARYVMARREFAHWQGVHRNGEDTPHRRAFEDSVLPVVRTGQSVLVDDDYAFEDGLWFEGAPGHTPGNVVIHARSGDADGRFYGRRDPPSAAAAQAGMVDARLHRSGIVAQDAHAADRGTCRARNPPAAGAFPGPTVGQIVRHGSAYSYTFE